MSSKVAIVRMSVICLEVENVLKRLHYINVFAAERFNGNDSNTGYILLS